MTHEILFYQKKLVLASRSPRRSELLREHGFSFACLPADDTAERAFDPARDRSPEDFVQEQAHAKAQNVAKRFPGEDLVVLGCDTVAVAAGVLLGKPQDRADARRMLRELSGSVHTVTTGFCLLNPRFFQQPHLEAVTTTLRMDSLSDTQLEAYLDSGRWEGKAGAFGYQDGNDWLEILEGTASNVVGLPVERLMELLGMAGGRKIFPQMEWK
ncbi:MAG: nucleoside triphosphate pyrophosphatase [Planctomycetia bacterium]|nr:nucleoside triphosphate pyrophosphatase [Planctomycetia bacterium]